jgi:protein-arginine kinase activator protein McsA
VLTDASEDEPLIQKEETKRPSSSRKSSSSSSMEQLKDIPYEQLKAMLDDALEKEDYERAAKIRDELNRRN